MGGRESARVNQFLANAERLAAVQKSMPQTIRVGDTDIKVDPDMLLQATQKLRSGGNLSPEMSAQINKTVTPEALAETIRNHPYYKSLASSDIPTMQRTTDALRDAHRRGIDLSRVAPSITAATPKYEGLRRAGHGLGRAVVSGVGVPWLMNAAEDLVKQ